MFIYHLCTLVTLVTLLHLTCAQICKETPDAQASTPPTFDHDEFTVDVEMSSKERQRVIQTTIYYSKPKNMLRMSIMDQSKMSDLYFYFMDDEILAFDYSQGRGSCSVKNISTAAESYIVGASKDGKIPEPLGVLRMIGQSGFGTNGSNPIKVQKAPATSTHRAITVNKYTSCQMWRMGAQDQVMKVTHMFSGGDWQFPDAQQVPVAIKVEGAGRLKNQTMGITHIYNFFNFRFFVNPEDLETPAGIYCPRRAPYPFPQTSNFIKFSAETMNGAWTTYSEEIYDFDDRFALYSTQAPQDYSSSSGFGKRTVFRDYNTGLSFDIDNYHQSCVVRNISDPMAQRLPFDKTQNGKVHELSADDFFYKTNNTFQYLGQRTVRSIPCDCYVTKTRLITEQTVQATIEWYFAKKGTKSWNDEVNGYVNGDLRMPVKFRMWANDQTTKSVDLNMFHVDYAKLRYGTINIRSCFNGAPSNFFQMVMPNARRAVVDANIDQFKWDSVFDLAITAQVIWWRVADLQIYFEADDVIAEFELLDAPPVSGDSPTPYHHIPLSLATAHLQAAVDKGYAFKAYNPKSRTFNQSLPVSDSSLSANTALAGDSGDGGITGGVMAGVGVAMVVVGVLVGGAGALKFTN